jgi:dinuclear metal center YbgI/SA1388 family protein
VISLGSFTFMNPALLVLLAWHRGSNRLQGMTSLQVADVMRAMAARYPLATAEEWDSVGLVVGDLDVAVSRVLFTVDVTPDVVEEAIAIGAQMIIAHHPLLLRGVTSLATSDIKGRIVSMLIKHSIALYTAHTNADAAWPGVSDALAVQLGLDVATGVSLSGTGIGRVGSLSAPVTLREFAQRVSDKLPQTARAVNVTGDLDSIVSTVAVCGGAGDSLLDAVAGLEVDAYVTSDLRHHVAQEFALTSSCALIDVSHWAAEWLWLPQAAQLLHQDLGGNVDVDVSTLVTDPWTHSQ